jgi:hypothetical protein
LCRSFLVLRFDPNTENPDHDEGEREGEQENIIQYHTSVKFFVYHRFLREQHSRLLCCQELCENIRPWAPLQITDSLPGPIVAIVDRNSSYQSSCVNSGCCAVHGHRARRPQTLLDARRRRRRNCHLGKQAPNGIKRLNSQNDHPVLSVVECVVLRDSLLTLESPLE